MSKEISNDLGIVDISIEIALDGTPSESQPKELFFYVTLF